MNKTLHFDVQIDENDFEENVLKILKQIYPDWDEKYVIFKIFSEGITNKLIGTYSLKHSGMILFRINGNKTDSLIDRNAEIKNIKYLNQYGLAPEIYATFSNGICYEFVPGVILNTKTVQEPAIWKLVAIKMAQMHKIPLTEDQKNVEPMVKRVGLKYLELVPEKFTNFEISERISKIFPCKCELSQRYLELLDILSSTKSQIVLCHNDLLLSNIIYTSDASKISFIDFEYAEPNYQGFDIGNHFAKICGGSSDGLIDYSKFPSKNFQMQWLEVYLKEFYGRSDVKLFEIEEMYEDTKKFVAAAHLFWTCWCLIQAEFSLVEFDFVRLGETYYNEYLYRRSQLQKNGC